MSWILRQIGADGSDPSHYPQHRREDGPDGKHWRVRSDAGWLAELTAMRPMGFEVIEVTRPEYDAVFAVAWAATIAANEAAEAERQTDRAAAISKIDNAGILTARERTALLG